ncbi:MAG: hypothetical protein WC233_01180 [Sphaerochaeta sp.]
MKKHIIAALTIFLLIGFGAYAANPGPSSFDITTNVQGINKMKITASEFTGTAPGQFDDAEAFAESLAISTSGTQEFSAWLSTMSNNRSGYKVTMTATAMKSTIAEKADSYINYTVTVNSKAITTNDGGASTPVSQDVITVTSLTGLAKQSHQITLSVDQTSFEAAVEGSYSGTVTFTYTAT